MANRTLSTIQRYAAAVLLVAIAVGVSIALRPIIAATPGVLLFAAVTATAWFARLGPALLAAALSAVALDYYMIEPYYTFTPSLEGFVRSALFGIVAAFAAAVGDIRRRWEERAQRSSATLDVTLASIGDAVLATDAAGTVTFLNDVAASLLGCSADEAVGRPLGEVFRIVNEETREPVQSPFEEVMASGSIAGLANHTLLLARDGREIPIEDSGAPIRTADGEIGGVVLVFRDDTHRRREERERERLLEAETLARAEAELAQQRFEYLAMASAVLSSSLDYETTLTSAVRMSVPRLADWASIDMLVDGRIERLAVAHIDPAKVEWGWELYRRFPPDPDAPSGVPAVIRTGQSEFLPEITEEIIRAATSDPELLEIIERIGFTSVMTVPLRTRDRVVGAISFVTAESRRRLDDSDLALAEDLARRASIAIENAELYRELDLQRRSLEVTLASIGDGVISTDDAGNVRFINRVAEELTGWKLEEAVGRPLPEVFEILDEATRSPVASPVERVLREKTIVEMSNGTMLIDRNGRERPIDDSAAPIRSDGDRIDGVVMTFRDVSERRRVEQQIRAQRDQLDAILGGVSDGITATTADGRIIFANDAAARATGFETAAQMLAERGSEIVGRYEIFDEEGRPLPPEQLPTRRAFAGETLSRTVQFSARGSRERRWTTISSRPVFSESGAVEFVINIFRDITNRVESERALRLRAAQQTAVAMLGQRALAGSDLEALFEDVVTTVAHTLDVELVKVLELLPDRSALRVRAGYGWPDGVVGRAIVDAGENSQAGYTLARQRSVITDDLQHEKRFKGAPLLHEHGVVSGVTVTIGFGREPYGILGVHSRTHREFNEDDAHFLESVANLLASSISRRRTEDLLARQREWLTVTLASIGDAVIATDIEGRISFMNAVATSLTGWSIDDAQGRPLDEVFDIVNEETLERAPNPANEALRHGVVVGLANHTVLRSRDGREIPIDDSAAPIRNGDGVVQGVVLVFHDVSERRQTEARLKLSESRFRLLVEQSPLSIQVFAADGSCIQANRAWEELWDSKREQLDGYNILHDRQLEAKGLLDQIRRGFAGEAQALPPVRYDPAEIGRVGRPRWTRAVIYPVIDESSAVREVVLVLEDVTERVVAEQRLQIQFETSRLLATDPSIEAAAAEVLASVGGALGASFAAFWLVDRARDVLRAAAVWTPAGSDVSAFVELTRSLELRRGEGLPGHIWTEKAPLFFSEMPDTAEWPRQRTALERGLGTGYGFPIMMAGEVFGVLEFFATGNAERREEIIETMSAVGRQIAQFVERRRAEEALRESEERYRTVAETASDAIFIVDEQSRILFANRAVEAVFGYDPNELIGGDLHQLMPDYLRAAHERAMRRYVETGVRHIDWGGVELPGVHRAGHIVPLEISFGEFTKEGRHFFTGIVRDITDRKRAERELKLAMEQAEAASAAKDQFLAVLSHELRTPLTPVLTLVQFLESADEPPEDSQAIFTMIRRNIELEARLIDDLLDLTRITRGKLHLDIEEVDAHNLLRNAIDICREEIAGKGLHLVLAFEASVHRVHGDPARLQQVFWNLVQNAVKFTPEDGTITVRTANPAPGRLEIAVTDTGIGMEREQLDRVFNAFEQAEQSISRRFGGLGLGLSISRSIVEMHGGTITVESAGLNQGSTFKVQIDAAADPAGTGASQPQNGDVGREDAARRILLVDDHADTSNVMKLLLERRGYHVETAMDVSSALEKARSNEFDLLISDIGLPDGSGLDLMRSIRAEKELAGIALSGFGMEEDIKRSREAGFSEHLIKPVNFQALQEAIRRVLG